MSALGTRDTGHGTRRGSRLIVGMGITGLSVARYFARAGVAFAVTDSRDAPPKMNELAALGDVPRRFGRLACPLALDGIVEAVISPGLSLDEPFVRELRAAGVPIVSDIDLFVRGVHQAPSPESRVPLVAITGSNGKSTVTAWVADVLDAAGLAVAVGGNFGTPALDLLAATPDCYVLELSSFQLESSDRLDASVAAVLNLSPDHIDRHGDMARYGAAKARILRGAGVAVINDDDARVRAMPTGGAQVRRFGSRSGCDYRLLEDGDGASLARGSRRWLACDALALAGRHNHFNALAVWALAEAVGVDADTVRARLPVFTGLPHRCQAVAEIGGVRWINDSKGTNLGALMASLEGMPAPVILLAGGQAKGTDFAPLAPLAAARTRAVIVFGEDRERIAEALAFMVTVVRVETLAEAVAEAARRARPGDTVLLSPGCASLDQFADFRARGDAFVAAVRELAA